MEGNNSATIKERLKSYFSLFKEKDTEEAIYNFINQGISFKGANLWILVFAIFMASLGLNVNSTAVIIGAMLISPLMGPIIGMGLSIGTNDFELLKKSLKNYLIATLISVVTATIYFFITPFDIAQSELLARTSPTLYDVLIAFFGGAAGIVAISTIGGRTGNVIPGVAIATALMPPLCTAGFGLGTGNLSFFFGAFYLYFINSVFIALATFLGVRMMRFRHKTFIDQKVYKRVRYYILALVIVTMVPAFFMTIKIVRDSIFQRNIDTFISSHFNQSGREVITHEVDKNSKKITLVSVGKEISSAEISLAESDLEKYKLGGYSFQVIQGRQSDSLVLLNNIVSDLTQSSNNFTQTITEQENKIKSLESKIADLNRYNELSEPIYKEVKILFPMISKFGFSKQIEFSEDKDKSGKAISKKSDKIVIVAQIAHKQKFSKEDEAKLVEWMKSKTGATNVELYIKNQ